jgi:hypothetical protein
MALLDEYGGQAKRCLPTLWYVQNYFVQSSRRRILPGLHFADANVLNLLKPREGKK